MNFSSIISDMGWCLSGNSWVEGNRQGLPGSKGQGHWVPNDRSRPHGTNSHPSKGKSFQISSDYPLFKHTTSETVVFYFLIWELGGLDFDLIKQHNTIFRQF